MDLTVGAMLSLRLLLRSGTESGRDKPAATSGTKSEEPSQTGSGQDEPRCQLSSSRVEMAASAAVNC